MDQLRQKAGVVARRQDGNRVIYSIAMPLVFELCELVCGRLAEQAAELAKALAGGTRSGPGRDKG